MTLGMDGWTMMGRRICVKRVRRARGFLRCGDWKESKRSPFVPEREESRWKCQRGGTRGGDRRKTAEVILSIRTVDFRVKGRGKHTAERAGGRQSRKGRGRRPSAWWEGGYGGCSWDSSSYTMKLFASLAHEWDERYAALGSKRNFQRSWKSTGLIHLPCNFLKL